MELGASFSEAKFLGLFFFERFLASSAAIRVEAFIEALRFPVGKVNKFVHLFDSNVDFLCFIESLEFVLTFIGDVEVSQHGPALIIEVGLPNFVLIDVVGVLVGRQDEGKRVVDSFWTPDAVDIAR